MGKTQKVEPSEGARSRATAGAVGCALAVAAVLLCGLDAQLVSEPPDDRAANLGDGQKVNEVLQRCGAPREHLSDLPSQGLHVLRADLTACDHAGEQQEAAATTSCGATFDVEVYIDGMATGAFSKHKFAVSCAAAVEPLGSEAEQQQVAVLLVKPIRRAIQSMRPLMLTQLRATGNLTQEAFVELSGRPGLVGTTDRSEFFTPNGHRVSATRAEILRAFRECGTLYWVEGGEFVWPGIRPGYSTTVSIPTHGEVKMTTVSLMPKVFTIDKLLADKECEEIIASTEPQMRASTVTTLGKQVDGAVDVDGFRTSTQVRFKLAETPQIEAVERRAHQLLRVPVSHGEPLQVIRYREGETYQAHTDYFDPMRYADSPEVMLQLEGGNRNRFATMLWYLNTPEQGGETLFPRAPRGGPLPNSHRCGLEADGSMRTDPSGVKVHAKTGRATLFYNMRPDGAIDPLSLHAGCPPEAGSVKFAVNRWFWSRPWKLRADQSEHERTFSAPKPDYWDNERTQMKMS